MDARQLLVDPHAHLSPAATLAGLSARDATRHVAGLPHSIAEIVAHMAYWQNWFIARCEGRQEAMAAHAALGWPAVDDADWPALGDDFVAGLHRLATIVSEHEPSAPVTPPIESPLLANYSYRDVWEHVAQHNAYHLGQVVILRQILDVWPPPSGSYTW